MDEVESAHCQLEELENVRVLTMRDVDFITELLPSHLKVELGRNYREMSSAKKVHPFIPFMKFLEDEREAVVRIEEKSHEEKRETLSMLRTKARKSIINVLILLKERTSLVKALKNVRSSIN